MKRWQNGSVRHPEEPVRSEGSMIEPVRAAVRPRVVSPETGDAVLLEDEVADWLKSRSRRLEIVGGPGTGKTTALQHLVAVFGPIEGVHWLDDAAAFDFEPRGRAVYTRGTPFAECGTVLTTLASWTDDELLEYCLNRHPDKCSSIFERCRAMPNRDRLEGIPELWAIVLEGLAADDSANDWRKVFADRLSSTLPEKAARHARDYCLATLLDYTDQAQTARRGLAAEGWSIDRIPWLRHRAVQVSFAAVDVVERLDENGGFFFLEKRWPADLLAESARVLANSPTAQQRLVHVVAGKLEAHHATAASLLHAMNRGWQPAPRTSARLTGAVFTGAVWPGINLSKAMLRQADLFGADLTGALLSFIDGRQASFRRATLIDARFWQAEMDGANVSSSDLTGVRAANSVWCHADFTSAVLRRADLTEAILEHADFSGACLSQALLTGASLNDAIFSATDLSHADLRHAKLRRVRLSDSALTGARFAEADLVEADLVGVHLPGADFKRASLRRAYLTGSVMPCANFHLADLREAGLADVGWEGADLRNADFSNCAFHLGSSRSGLVGSPIACEGSRTGFYTDDFLGQDFKSPEEIRKADLRGADLRGARVHHADFYLVDLRGARFTSDQADHFRRCGAILVDRVQRT
jgi:uncharacterized protein YjbI with pentapeptide repeats